MLDSLKLTGTLDAMSAMSVIGRAELEVAVTVDVVGPVGSVTTTLTIVALLTGAAR